MAGRTKSVQKTIRPKRAPRELGPSPNSTYATHVCTCCGKEYLNQKGNFNSSYSVLYAMNNGYGTICKECTDRLFEHYCAVLGDEKEAVKRMCMIFDVYFNEGAFLSCHKRNASTTLYQSYLKMINLKQAKGKTFDDYLSEQKILKIKNGEGGEKAPGGKKSRVTKEMIDFWGPDLEEDDYLSLQAEYNDWTTRYECKTKAQEELYRALAMAQQTLNKAYQSGDIKRIKDATDMQQALMGSANIKPNQKNESIGNELTYGQWIQKIEETEPIPEPATEWADVDGIGKYFRTWVLGTVLRMLGIKNPFKQEFDDEIEKYTVNKPEYVADEDDGQSSVRNALFGLENKDGA